MDYAQEYNDYQKELKRKYALTLETHDIAIAQTGKCLDAPAGINLRFSGD